MSKLLLHHCCAPCSVNVVDILIKEYEIKSFWFNPNIQPDKEYQNRLESLERFVRSFNGFLYYGPEYSGNLWIKKPGYDRCYSCYDLRLDETAKAAKKLGIKYFTTTLLSSPYQKHEVIKSMGKEIAKKEGLEFVYRDFREFYYDGKNRARREGYYMQKYCGCGLSLLERNEQKNSKKQSV
ncbi:MAG: epoxyqueuosine reductase QueH [Endomicrobiales bacterium]|nr:epoxyqueuosine reductase QueH [Endomicrobiales bacterium]